MPNQTPTNPTCPNCGQPMALISPPNGDHDHHTFECGGCKVAYMTEDHIPVSGKRPPQSDVKPGAPELGLPAANLKARWASSSVVAAPCS